MGTIAYIVVAITAGGFPKPKNSIAGIKYTNTGMVCIVSKIGRIILSALLLEDTSIPIGNPNNSEIKTDAIMIDKVSIINAHKPDIPIKNNNAPYNILLLIFPEIFHVAIIIKSIKTDQGINSSALFIIPTKLDKDFVITPKKASYLTLKDLTALSIAFKFKGSLNGKLYIQFIIHSPPLFT